MLSWFRCLSVILLLVFFTAKLVCISFYADDGKAEVVLNDENESEKTEGDIFKTKTDLILCTLFTNYDLHSTEIVTEFIPYLNQLPGKHISSVPTPPPQA